MWVLEDLVAAIADTNSTYGRKDANGNITVANAPVKRLVDTWIDPVYLTDKGYIAYAQPAIEAGLTHPLDVKVVMITEEFTGVVDDIPKSFKESFTGRVSNSVYDVVPFRFTIDVEAKHTRDLMAKLINQRYITITECKMLGVDRDYLQKCGLVYGDERCVQMTIDAELLLFRQWTQPLMPDVVKEKNGHHQTPAARYVTCFYSMPRFNLRDDSQLEATHE